MKLYYAKGACSLAVRIVIHEIGMSCKFESVDFATKKTETREDFLKINPKGAVPTLRINEEEVLTENAVIQQYLADQHQAHKLLPEIPDFKRYQVLEWLNYVSTELHKGFGPIFSSNIPQLMKDEIFIPMLKKKFEYVDRCLQDKKYLLGDTFTLPDAYAFVTIFWLSRKNIDVSHLKNLTRYYEELKQRKAIVQSLREEGF